VTSERYLDNIESWHLNRARTQVVEYRGTLDVDKMARAFELVCAHYPVLRARIRPDGDQHLLYIPSDHRPEFAVFTGDSDTLVREVRQAWDPAIAVARLILVYGDDQGRLALRMDHSVIDGRAWTTMFYELWMLYTDLVASNTISIEPGTSLPCPPADLFKLHYGEDPYEFLEDPSDDANPAEVIEGRVVLDEHETEKLITAARMHDTSVHALICGAILVSHRGTTSTAEQMACLSPIDLRSRVKPTVGPTDTTNFIGFHMAELAVALDAEPVAVGREVKHQMESSLTGGKLPPVDMVRFLNARAKQPREQRQNFVLVTNLGVLSSFAHPANLTITDWQRLTGSKPDSFPVYGVFTYERRLHLHYFFPSSLCSNDQINRLVTGAIDQLRSIIRTGESDAL
jgi:hypothetical protein